MTLVQGIVRVLFLLLMQSAIWSLCVCKPIKKEELSLLDEDLFDKYFSQKPFWPPTLRPPFVWPTWDPYPFTHRPRDFYDKPSTNASELHIFLKVFIVILMLIGCFVALICMHFVCKACKSIREPTAVLHPPPARISPTNLDINLPQIQYRVMPTYARSSASLSSLRTQLFENGTVPTDTGTSNIYNNVTDKPPSYSEVVTTDSTDGTSKFPDVSVTGPRESSPPPKYDKGDLPKF